VLGKFRVRELRLEMLTLMKEQISRKIAVIQPRTWYWYLTLSHFSCARLQVATVQQQRGRRPEIPLGISPAMEIRECSVPVRSHKTVRILETVITYNTHGANFYIHALVLQSNLHTTIRGIRTTCLYRSKS
jgi:hypothetical protein